MTQTSWWEGHKGIGCPVCSVVGHTVRLIDPPPNLVGTYYRLENGREPLSVTGYCTGCGSVEVRYASSGWHNLVPPGKLVPYRGTAILPKLKGPRCTKDTKNTKPGTAQGFRTSIAEALAVKDQFFGTNKKDKDMKTLYEFEAANGDKLYGHRLATNTAGLWVMETRDGSITTVERVAVTEVMPYTVDVAYLGADNQNYSFFAVAGDVEVGDVLACVDYSNLMTVVGVNTRSRQATKWLHGSKLAVSTIIAVRDDGAS